MKWIANNCHQCWNCKNFSGQIEVSLYDALISQQKFVGHMDINIVDKDAIKSAKVLLPQCHVMDDSAMTYVFDSPCRCFQLNIEDAFI